MSMQLRVALSRVILLVYILLGPAVCSSALGGSDFGLRPVVQQIDCKRFVTPQMIRRSCLTMWGVFVAVLVAITITLSGCGSGSGSATATTMPTITPTLHIESRYKLEDCDAFEDGFIFHEHQDCNMRQLRNGFYYYGEQSVNYFRNALQNPQQWYICPGGDIDQVRTCGTVSCQLAWAQSAEECGGVQCACARDSGEGVSSGPFTEADSVMDLIAEIQSPMTASHSGFPWYQVKYEWDGDKHRALMYRVQEKFAQLTGISAAYQSMLLALAFASGAVSSQPLARSNSLPCRECCRCFPSSLLAWSLRNAVLAATKVYEVPTEISYNNTTNFNHGNSEAHQEHATWLLGVWPQLIFLGMQAVVWQETALLIFLAWFGAAIVGDLCSHDLCSDCGRNGLADVMLERFILLFVGQAACCTFCFCPGWVAFYLTILFALHNCCNCLSHWVLMNVEIALGLLGYMQITTAVQIYLDCSFSPWFFGCWAGMSTLCQILYIWLQGPPSASGCSSQNTQLEEMGTVASGPSAISGNMIWYIIEVVGLVAFLVRMARAAPCTDIVGPPVLVEDPESHAYSAVRSAAVQHFACEQHAEEEENATAAPLTGD